MMNMNIVRRIDELGRVTLPIEIRRALYLTSEDFVQVRVEDGKITLTKVEDSDIFTGAKEDLIAYRRLDSLQW